jgi:hypothetical protein
MNDRQKFDSDIWFMLVFAILILTLFFARAAHAAEPESAPASAPVVEVVPLEAGGVAPFAGLLVPEETFVKYLRQRLMVDELTAKLEIRDRLLAEKPLVEKTPPTFGVGWSFVVGLGVGVVLSSLIVYGAVQVLKASP